MYNILDGQTDRQTDSYQESIDRSDSIVRYYTYYTILDRVRDVMTDRTGEIGRQDKTRHQASNKVTHSYPPPHLLPFTLTSIRPDNLSLLSSIDRNVKSIINISAVFATKFITSLDDAPYNSSSYSRYYYYYY